MRYLKRDYSKSLSPVPDQALQINRMDVGIFLPQSNQEPWYRLNGRKEIVVHKKWSAASGCFFDLFIQGFGELLCGGSPGFQVKGVFLSAFQHIKCNAVHSCTVFAGRVQPSLIPKEIPKGEVIHPHIAIF